MGQTVSVFIAKTCSGRLCTGYNSQSRPWYFLYMNAESLLRWEFCSRSLFFLANAFQSRNSDYEEIEQKLRIQYANFLRASIAQSWNKSESPISPSDEDFVMSYKLPDRTYAKDRRSVETL